MHATTAAKPKALTEAASTPSTADSAAISATVPLLKSAAALKSAEGAAAAGQQQTLHGKRVCTGDSDGYANDTPLSSPESTVSTGLHLSLTSSSSASSLRRRRGHVAVSYDDSGDAAATPLSRKSSGIIISRSSSGTAAAASPSTLLTSRDSMTARIDDGTPLISREIASFNDGTPLISRETAASYDEGTSSIMPTRRVTASSFSLAHAGDDDADPDAELIQLAAAASASSSSLASEIPGLPPTRDSRALGGGEVYSTAIAAASEAAITSLISSRGLPASNSTARRPMVDVERKRPACSPDAAPPSYSTDAAAAAASVIGADAEASSAATVYSLSVSSSSPSPAHASAGGSADNCAVADAHQLQLAQGTRVIQPRKLHGTAAASQVELVLVPPGRRYDVELPTKMVTYFFVGIMCCFAWPLAMQTGWLP